MSRILGDEEMDSKYRKHNVQVSKHRMGMAAFLVGLAVGFIAAERFYLYQNMSDGKLPPWYSSSGGSAAISAPAATSVQQGSGRQVANSQVHVGQSVQHSVHPVHDTPSTKPQPQQPRSHALKPTRAAHSSGDLLALLETVAPNKEVMIAVSDYNLVREGMLTTWINCVKRAGVENYLVVGLDEEIYKHLQKQGVPVYYKNKQITAAQAGTGSNHAISSLKFGIIKEFLNLGWSVLLSDVDIVVIQDPFKHLYRDSDVEGMSDGFDERTAYGFIDGHDDPSMGWARYAQAVKHFNFNSGLFYLMANERTIELMQRLETRLSREKYWDQTAYNEEIFFLSHGSYKSPQVTVRVMDIYEFMNSKTLFKFVRKMPKAQQKKPVMVHINYHPNKHERMKGVIAYYLDGNTKALDHFPGGSEPGT